VLLAGVDVMLLNSDVVSGVLLLPMMSPRVLMPAEADGFSAMEGDSGVVGVWFNKHPPSCTPSMAERATVQLEAWDGVLEARLCSGFATIYWPPRSLSTRFVCNQ
jgi:hypothetical protein